MYITESRAKSFFIVCIVYVLATVVGVLSYVWAASRMDALWALLLADVVATVFTWAAGLLYKNVSVYDPYWSVLPPVLLSLYACLMPGISLSGVLMLLVVWVWAIRLTGNWAVTFQGLRHEDWRYTKYRTSCHPVIFHIINFFGLNMMPTLVVFLAMIPAIRILQNAPDCTIWTCLGALMSLAAAAIQYSADTTAHRFRREHKGEICKEGLWRHGRHPNYFGEILMWWGIWVMALPTDSFLGLPMVDWTIAGAISITLLFLCISVPLMESRQMKNKPGYAQYRKETRVLISFAFALTLSLSFLFSLSASAQTYREDGYSYYYDYDHRIVVRSCIEVTNDYQDLWNGDYGRIINGYVYIYRNGSRVLYGDRIWLEHTGHYTVYRSGYYYLYESDGDRVGGMYGDNMFALWNGVYEVLRGGYWYLYTSDGYRLGNAYSTEEITIYWNGYYCVRSGSYYYIYGPDGYRVNGIYSDDEPTLTNAGYFRCTHSGYSYLYDTTGRRVN